MFYIIFIITATGAHIVESMDFHSLTVVMIFQIIIFNSVSHCTNMTQCSLRWVVFLVLSSISESTVTNTLSLTDTFSGSRTKSSTVPTQTETVWTLTKSLTESESDSDSRSTTESNSKTTSLSMSISPTLPSINNYTMEYSPEVFYEGQEIRLEITSILEDPSGEYPVNVFNITYDDLLEVRMYVLQSNNRDLDCAGIPHASTTKFGVKSSQKSSRFISSALVTFTAPFSESEFYFCFKHLPAPLMPGEPKIDSNTFGEWLLFASSSLSTVVLKSEPAVLTYEINSPTAGQNAVVKFSVSDPYRESVLFSDEGWNFTFPPSSCLSTSIQCSHGDSAKIVPVGVSCTAEHLSSSETDYYLGTSHVSNDGSWKLTNIATALSENSVPGGVIALGTRQNNPFTSVWTMPGQPSTKRLFGYLELPLEGTFEICFSSVFHREFIKNGNHSIENTPVWRKAVNAMTKQFSFTVLNESFVWSTTDVTPDTYGTINVIDSMKRNWMRSLQKDETSTTMNPVSTHSYEYPYPADLLSDYWNMSGMKPPISFFFSLFFFPFFFFFLWVFLLQKKKKKKKKKTKQEPN